MRRERKCVTFETRMYAITEREKLRYENIILLLLKQITFPPGCVAPQFSTPRLLDYYNSINYGIFSFNDDTISFHHHAVSCLAVLHIYTESSVAYYNRPTWFLYSRISTNSYVQLYAGLHTVVPIQSSMVIVFKWLSCRPIILLCVGCLILLIGV